MTAGDAFSKKPLISRGASKSYSFSALTAPTDPSQEVMPPLSLLQENPQAYWKTYRQDGGEQWKEAVPTAYQYWLAQEGVPVLTTATDGLQRKAGSREVFELAGSRRYLLCATCGGGYRAEDFLQQEVPQCSFHEVALRPYVEQQSRPALGEARALLVSSHPLLVSGFSTLTPALKEVLQVVTHARLPLWVVGPTPPPEDLPYERRVAAPYEDLPSLLTSLLSHS